VASRRSKTDLSTIEGVDRLLAAAQGRRQVDLLCANAGHGLGGAFLDQGSPTGGM
jgi:short-subunit dehydrogenase